MERPLLTPSTYHVEDTRHGTSLVLYDDTRHDAHLVLFKLTPGQPISKAPSVQMISLTMLYSHQRFEWSAIFSNNFIKKFWFGFVVFTWKRYEKKIFEENSKNAYLIALKRLPIHTDLISGTSYKSPVLYTPFASACRSNLCEYTLTSSLWRGVFCTWTHLYRPLTVNQWGNVKSECQATTKSGLRSTFH